MVEPGNLLGTHRGGDVRAELVVLHPLTWPPRDDDEDVIPGGEGSEPPIGAARGARAHGNCSLSPDDEPVLSNHRPVV